MTQKMPSLLIVGGGIGGMTLALSCAQKGISVTVLEQAPVFRETGAGILLCPNVFKMFTRLGIADAMKKIACFPEKLIYADGLTGSTFLNITMGEKIVSKFNYPYGSFHREELLHALVRECQKYPQIKLVAGAKVIAVEEKNERVMAQIEKGERFEADLLVGADGLWSLVRRHIIGDTEPLASGHITHRGVVSIESLPEKLRPNRVIHWDRPDGHLVQYPIGTKGLFNIVAVYHTTKPFDKENPKGDREELQKKFSGSLPEIMQLVSLVDTTRCWMMYDRDPCKVWSKGRMTLLGDSAHPTLPHLTQGAGMAIEDAVVLAEMLFNHPQDYQEAFSAYEKVRYLRTAHVQLFSRAYGEVHHLDGVARELRNQLLAKRSEEENYDWLGMMYKGIDL